MLCIACCPTALVCAALQCSTDTLSRRLKGRGSGYRHHLSDEEVLQAADVHCHLAENGRAAGQRVVQAALFSQAGLRPPRSQLLEVLRQHDPAAMAARQERILHRQAYDTAEAMVTWHIDSKATGCVPQLCAWIR